MQWTSNDYATLQKVEVRAQYWDCKDVLYFTLDPACNEFGDKEYPSLNRFLCTKIINSNVKIFSHNERSHRTSNFICIFARFKRDPMYFVPKMFCSRQVSVRSPQCACPCVKVWSPPSHSPEAYNRTIHCWTILITGRIRDVLLPSANFLCATDVYFTTLSLKSKVIQKYFLSIYNICYQIYRSWTKPYLKIG